MFATSWQSHEPSKKRKKTFLEQVDTHAHNTLPVQFSSDLEQTICRKLNAQYPSPEITDLNLDHILSKVSYKSMLENLFGNVDKQIPDVPILTKCYEESFMRQVTQGERACVMGELCECMFIDKGAPFISVELRLQGDPESPQMCVLCSRKTTQKMFYDMTFTGKATNAVIQRYGNIFGQPNEYSVECMLICTKALGFASMPVPCMSHQRNRYSVISHGGIKHLNQHRVSYEDFASPLNADAV